MTDAVVEEPSETDAVAEEAGMTDTTGNEAPKTDSSERNTVESHAVKTGSKSPQKKTDPLVGYSITQD